MIVTVTPNPALDRILVVPAFQPGTMNRAAVERTEVGGKGINVARHLVRLGLPVTATGFLGDGDIHATAETIASMGIQTDFVRVPGETRVNIKILDSATGQETEINETGPAITEGDVDVLLEKLRILAGRCSVMVFSGSLPPGVPDDLYARGITLAALAGAKTVLDAAGAALRHGIAAAPDLVKPNRAEAADLLGLPGLDDDDLHAAVVALVELGAKAAVISAGPAGAVCASAAGAWQGRTPAIAARRTVGSGDAMVAALTWGIARSQPVHESLHFAIALSTASAASHAVIPDSEMVKALMPRVTVQEIAGLDAGALR